MSCEIKCVSKVVELDRIKKLFGLASGKQRFDQEMELRDGVCFRVP